MITGKDLVYALVQLPQDAAVLMELPDKRLIPVTGARLFKRGVTPSIIIECGDGVDEHATPRAPGVAGMNNPSS